MAVKELVLYPSSLLREKCKEVLDLRQVSEIIRDLKDTLIAEEGLGLAAPQIGSSYRVFVFWRSTADGNKFIETIINPEVILSGFKIDSEEGCLSIPRYRDVVQRRSNATLKGLNELGEEVKFELEGLEARCVQHELDHLNGILFIDHFSVDQKRLFNSWVKKQDWFKRP